MAVQEYGKYRFYKLQSFVINLTGSLKYTLNIPFSQLRYLLCIASTNNLITEIIKKIDRNIDTISHPNFMEFSRNNVFIKTKNNCYETNVVHQDYFAQHIFTGSNTNENHSFDIKIE